MSTQPTPFPTLKKIDPCEGCTRYCHDCQFKEAHFDAMDQKVREDMVDYYFEIRRRVKPE